MSPTDVVIDTTNVLSKFSVALSQESADFGGYAGEFIFLYSYVDIACR